MRHNCCVLSEATLEGHDERPHGATRKGLRFLLLDWVKENLAFLNIRTLCRPLIAAAVGDPCFMVLLTRRTSLQMPVCSLLPSTALILLLRSIGGVLLKLQLLHHSQLHQEQHGLHLTARC